MEKAFSIEPGEQQLLDQSRQEQQTALAQFGAATLDLEAAKKRLESAAERQQTIVRSLLANRGVEHFQSARVDGNNIRYAVPDLPEAAPKPGPTPAPNSKRANGAPAGAGE